ncbi:hypothetical protein HPC49_15905 [Pyxidicoccus fallax]|uniref:Circularly permuted type 2 ATP-grasp protein n=1 Tax=Pyxidicoccus fallax TaxID=394095 RepID=A0A848LEZ7_9BACT|nr:hypothetical protein [Pyxidicoccus fallax]NMO14851.1 circularly permuted type 2 ATP-grasp protein [Pyxidicoccus fallax]NPC79703.1 hypothetical protein [Pyxidicoccus fallax]
MPGNELQEAISFYDGLLQGEVLRRTHELLLQHTQATGVTYGGRSLYQVLRPRFLTPRQLEEHQRATLVVRRGIEAVYRHACRDESFRRELGVQDWEELLMRVDGESRMPTVVGRLDGFVGPDGVLRFMEYNPAPGGYLLMHLLGEAFTATPVLEAFSRRYDVTFPRTAPNIIDALKANHARMGRAGMPQLVLFGPAGPDDVDEEKLLQSYLLEQGVRFEHVTSEDEWTYRDGALYVRDFRVDVVTFISSVGFAGMLVGCGPEHPVTRALTDGAAYFMNGLFQLCVMNSKVLFAALSTPTNAHLFEPDVREALARHIPWTRVVRECTTSYGGKDVDLLSFVSAHRERFVLKPATGYGGMGVMLGWLADAEAWNATLKQALEEKWVVQERVLTDQESYPILGESGLHFAERYTDLNPYVWTDTRQEGYFVRVSPKPMMNLTQGGSLAPLAVVRER